MILMIDNYDSFTFNLYQYLCELGAEVQVVRNDQITIEEIIKADFSAIILSPGPGNPDNAGICLDVITNLSGKIPILGVCLGHQAIVQAFGGTIVRAPVPVHGKPGQISHQGQGLYQDIPSPFSAGRYHSLVAEKGSIPECLETRATLVDPGSGQTLIMGVKHHQHPTMGIQFHPESILTEHGKKLLANFLALAAAPVSGAN